MIYACEDCGFIFYRVSEICECPFCEKSHIRPATREESDQIQPLLKPQKRTIDVKKEKGT